VKEDKTRQRRLIFSGLAVISGALLILAIAIPDISSAQETAAPEKMVFQARLMPKAGEQPAMVQVEVNGTTTPDEAGHLRETLAMNGDTGFLTEFRKMPKGFMKFYAGGQPAIRFNAAYVTPTDKGTRITLFAEDTTLGFVSNDAPVGLFFMVVVLDVNEKGRGDGRLYQGASIKFTDDNRMELDTYRRSPIIIIQVRKSK